MSDSDMINREVSAAESEGREISDACARMIASQYHAGSASVSYSFASSGAISDATAVYRDCFYLPSGTAVYLSPAGKRAADFLGRYLIAAVRASETSSRGPVEGWSALWISSPREAPNDGWGPQGSARNDNDIQHANYPHEPGALYDCPGCESQCHCTPGSTECIFEGQHSGSADPGLTDGTLCGNCGRTAAQAGCTLRTRVTDWRTEYMCDRCVLSFDWADWTFDGVATYRRTGHEQR
jgi:hypothetical protein